MLCFVVLLFSQTWFGSSDDQKLYESAARRYITEKYSMLVFA